MWDRGAEPSHREQDEGCGPDVSRLAGTVTPLPREGTYNAP
jgi:hypothetical protein